MNCLHRSNADSSRILVQSKLNAFCMTIATPSGNFYKSGYSTRGSSWRILTASNVAGFGRVLEVLIEFFSYKIKSETIFLWFCVCFMLIEKQAAYVSNLVENKLSLIRSIYIVFLNQVLLILCWSLQTWQNISFLCLVGGSHTSKLETPSRWNLNKISKFEVHILVYRKSLKTSCCAAFLQCRVIVSESCIIWTLSWAPHGFSPKYPGAVPRFIRQTGREKKDTDISNVLRYVISGSIARDDTLGWFQFRSVTCCSAGLLGTDAFPFGQRAGFFEVWRQFLACICQKWPCFIRISSYVRGFIVYVS